MEAFESLGEACGGSGRLGLHGAVGVAELACGGNGAVEILACQNHGAVDEIAENGDKLVVVARLEVGPGEVIIFGLGSVGGQNITQHVLLAGEIGEIFVKPHSPVP